MLWGGSAPYSQCVNHHFHHHFRHHFAITFANKPYFFNLDNVARYVGSDINVSAADNSPLSHSYERLAELLFPNLPSSQAS